jgi:hypothetical protein
MLPRFCSCVPELEKRVHVAIPIGLNIVKLPSNGIQAAKILALLVSELEKNTCNDSIKSSTVKPPIRWNTICLDPVVMFQNRRRNTCNNSLPIRSVERNPDPMEQRLPGSCSCILESEKNTCNDSKSDRAWRNSESAEYRLPRFYCRVLESEKKERMQRFQIGSSTAKLRARGIQAS